jgi:hypothetical protein
LGAAGVAAEVELSWPSSVADLFAKYTMKAEISSRSQKPTLRFFGGAATGAALATTGGGFAGAPQ